MDNNFDTIASVITPMAKSAVGIIRISGDLAYNIAKSIFSGKIAPKEINHGYIKDGSKTVDEVVLLYFKAPKSYTGEDVIEIQTHGNPYILNTIINLIISKGARQSLRGEFTKRAFLNHRIDLSQAEAVMDIIDSRSQKAATNALNNLDGYLKNKITDIKDNLVELYSKLIASIDFPEDVGDVDDNTIVSICNDNINLIDDILKNSKSHNFIRDGINVCLIGAPNVGKSSLFNSLLNYNRAIVTDIEGTTRDTISESLDLDGFIVNFVDTAGIRDKKSADFVEKIGIENSIETIKKSDVVLFLFEKSKDEIDSKLLELANNKEVLYVKTKVDINPSNVSSDIVETSAKTGFGVNVLKENILKLVRNLVPDDTLYTTNKRQQACLLRAKEAIINALNSKDETELTDLIATDIKAAIIALDELTGEVLTDKILDNIFDNFCIGK